MAKETILVVDDEKHIVELAKLYLEKEGYRVENACDGAEALAKIKSLQPALVVLDLMLPEIDGWEVCRRARGDSDIPIIFGRSYQVDKSRAVQNREIGLDLTIAKQIIEAHKGTIGVESVIGLGTKFTVSLPIVKKSY